MAKRILLTGGVGYIGSSVGKYLLDNGFEIRVLDNLSTGSIENLDKRADFKKGDIRNSKDVAESLVDVDCVVHLAGYKFASESVKEPDLVFDINVNGTKNLVEEMKNYGVNKIVFASTCAVYGTPHKLPVHENFPIKPESPYGQSKVDAENLIMNSDWLDSIILRYFNVVGSGFSNVLDRSPFGLFSNVMKNLELKTAAEISGRDYETLDGTAVRDYIHVRDLTIAHNKAVDFLMAKEKVKETANLSSGVGTSVMQIMEEFVAATSGSFTYTLKDRRAGDPASIYGSTEHAELLLGFRPTLDMASIVNSTLEDW